MEILNKSVKNLKWVYVTQVTPPRQKNLMDVFQDYMKLAKAINCSSSYFMATLSKLTFQVILEEKVMLHAYLCETIFSLEFIKLQLLDFGM